MQVGINVTCIYTNFGGCSYFDFRDTATLKMAKFSFRTMGYSPWSSKNLINWNRLKKFIQVGIDVTCIYTNFGGCGYFGFGDTASI